MILVYEILRYLILIHFRNKLSSVYCHLAKQKYLAPSTKTEAKNSPAAEAQQSNSPYTPVYTRSSTSRRILSDNSPPSDFGDSVGFPAASSASQQQQPKKRDHLLVDANNNDLEMAVHSELTKEIFINNMVPYSPVSPAYTPPSSSSASSSHDEHSTRIKPAKQPTKKFTDGLIKHTITSFGQNFKVFNKFSHATNQQQASELQSTAVAINTPVSISSASPSPLSSASASSSSSSSTYTTPNPHPNSNPVTSIQHEFNTPKSKHKYASDADNAAGEAHRNHQQHQQNTPAQIWVNAKI